MTGIRYPVEIDFITKGDPSRGISGADAGLAHLTSTAGKAKSAMADIGSGLANGFTGAVEFVGGKLMSLGKVAAAAGIGAITYSVTSLNNELEQARMSLGAVLNSKGVTDGIEEGLQRATGLIGMMRKDAKDLPGEFSDLQNIFMSGLGSALNAGMSDVGFERMAAQAMAAGKSLAIPLDQAGRELAQLLEGRAGAHNVFGTRLGIKAYEFNPNSGKTDADRVKILTAALEKFQPAIAKFGDTFDAQSSTLLDNIKAFAGRATMPLFERIKDTLGDINAWFDANQATVGLYADKIGIFLVDAFDKGKAIVLEWGPLLVDFASKAMDRLERGWATVEPYVSSVAGWLKDGLANADGTLDKIENVLMLYAAVKGGGALLGAAGKASTLFDAGRGLLSGGGGAAAAEAAGAAGGDAAIAAEWAAANTSGMEATLAGLGTQAAAAGAGLTALLAAIPAGALLAIGETISEIADARQKAQTLDAGPRDEYSEGARAFTDKMIREAIDAGSALDKMANNTGDTIAGLTATGEAADHLAFVLNTLAQNADFASIALINAGINAKQQQALFDADAAKVGTDAATTLGNTLAAAALASLDKADAAKAKKDKADKERRGPGMVVNGGIRITISSNQAPSQIAHEVMKEIADRRRNPRSSRAARDFGAREP